MALLHVGRQHRLGKPVVVEQTGGAVGKQLEEAAEVSSEADRIDEEAGEVAEVDRVAEQKRAGRLEEVEEPPPTGPATFGGEHVVFPDERIRSGDLENPCY
jgi:hypothetical protein